MAKRPSAFRPPEEDAPPAPPPAAPAPAAAAPPAASPPAAKPNPRAGKANFTFWVSEPARRQIKVMAAEEGVTIQDYMTSVLNSHFARKGRPQVA